MKKIMLIAVLCFSTPFVFASGHDLLDEEACKETKEGIGYVLGVADYLFKENEKNNTRMQTEEERKANERRTSWWCNCFFSGCCELLNCLRSLV